MKNKEVISKWRDSDKSITEGDFTLLPDWTWGGIETLLNMEIEWNYLTNMLNRGKDIIDLEYWCVSNRKDEYKKLKLDLEEVEIKMTKFSHNLIESLVEWRDTNYSCLSYDEDGGESYKNNEPFIDAVAYFGMSIRRDWYKAPFETDAGVVRYRKTREKIREKINKEFGN